MAETIRDGTGGGNLIKVTSDNRALVDGLFEPISAERSRAGALWGVGTGGLTVNSSMSTAPVMWFRNDDPDLDIAVQKLIFGWDGGGGDSDATIFDLIFYNQSSFTTNVQSIDAQIENISKSGSTAPVVRTNFSAQKWDGSSHGMTGQTGGFAQIPNTLAKGNNSIPIDGEIVLGPGNSMTFAVTAQTAGTFHVAAVFYDVPVGQGRSFI